MEIIIPPEFFGGFIILRDLEYRHHSCIACHLVKLRLC